MALAAAEQKEKPEVLSHLDQLARRNAQKVLIQKHLQDNLVNEAMKRLFHIAHQIAVRLTHTKLLQLIPIIGSAVAAGVNYLYTREIIQYGMMVYRKRWLMQKYHVFNEETSLENDEKLFTSWIMMPCTSEEEVEFEADLRPLS